LLDRKKSNGNTKANKQATENTELVYNALVSVGKAVTITELIAQTDLSALANEDHIVTTQKISAYLKKLVESGRVVKTTDKKKTYFMVVELVNE
jgi:predicted transcriptional regulator